MISFAESEEGGNQRIARGMAIVKGFIADVVGERVYEEGCLVGEEDAEDGGVDETAADIVPAVVGDADGKYIAEE